ncbi:metallophosphoesterase [Paenibacillus lupini]|uniref:metallophosphoesterase n=1 Tax=Paenibacillus lupini TaxID=1450204 RepID=UPI001421B8D5|nr:metallophosphoesterase [Paenibacillus lupini]NIK22438.1 hypothetical protein [Paenibacillus lupini]
MQWSFVERTNYYIKSNVKHSIRIVHLTDLHGTIRFLNGSISGIINDIQPDLIMVTGDLVSNQRRLEKVLNELGRLACKQVYFVPGNYEREQTIRFKKQPLTADQYNKILQQLQSNNITVLDNKHSVVHIHSSRILVYGFDNSIYGNERYNSNIDIETYDFKMLLAHSPSIITELENQNISYDLLLAGHTHGGQIRLSNRTFGAYKHFHIGMKLMGEGRHFLINRGLGTVRIPLRVNCRPEIAVIHINPK